MCVKNDFSVGVVLGQQRDKHCQPIHYASKTLIEALENHTTNEKKLLSLVFAFDNFCSYSVLSKVVVYTNRFCTMLSLNQIKY